MTKLYNTDDPTTENLDPLVSAALKNELYETDHIPAEKKAVIYARKSNKAESHSIDSQIALGKEWINKKGLIFYKAYYNSESASKYTYDKRPAFSQLMSDIGKGDFKNIVVLKRDRLSRRFEKLLQIKQKFIKNNIKVHYSAPGEYQASDGDTYAAFIENIIMAVGEYESDIGKERTDTGKRIKRELGSYSRSGDIPFGYSAKSTEQDQYYSREQMQYEAEKTNEDCELVIHEEEAAVVKSIFKEYVSKSYSIKDITAFAMKINKCQRYLNKNKIEYMLTNPTYAGIQRPNNGNSLFSKGNKGYEIDDTNIRKLAKVPALIDQELWSSAALKYLNSKRKNKKRIENYLFKNLLQCSTCGKNITFSVNNYYKCPNKKCTNIKGNVLIDKLFNRIIEDMYDPERANEIIKEQIREIRNKKNSLQKELRATTSYKRTYLLKLTKSSDPTSQGHEIKKLIKQENELLERITACEDRITALQNISGDLDKLRIKGTIADIKGYLKNSSNLKHVQELLSNIIEKVSISGSTKRCTIECIEYGAI